MLYESQDVWFERPPVAEVALALQTAPIPGLTSAHFGLFWDRVLRAEYPIVQEQPPAPPLIEQSGVPPFGGPQIMVGPMIGSRHWYLSEDQARIVQIQQDRLIVNWRRLTTDVYPHYAKLRADLYEIASAWREFLASFDFPAMPVLQSEVTYVNHIAAIDDDGVELGVGDVLAALTPAWPVETGAPEALQFEQSFAVGETSPTRSGKLHLQFAPAMLAFGEKKYVFNLVFRMHGQSSVEEAMEAMDLGHNQITNTFRDVTTTKMHRMWGEADDLRD